MIGNTRITHVAAPMPVSETRAAANAFKAYEAVYHFSARLLEDYEPQAMLQSLLDAVIEITRADKGFILLFEGAEPRVRVARNLKRENIADAVEQLSDSIVEKVLKTRAPVIVSA